MGFLQNESIIDMNKITIAQSTQMTSLSKEKNMTARRPEECDLLIFEAIKNKNLEAAVALYEPNATFVLDSGEAVTGHAAIRETLKGWMDLEDPQFTTELKAYLNAEENLAMLRGSWSAIAKGPDGKPIKISGKNVEVVRRQPDGTWRFVIDHPRGAD
jgi:ketosteroid isomerase-like protein